jgi:hypothetical protein
MEDLNFNAVDEAFYNNQPQLTISQDSGLNFQNLLKTNQIYSNQLLNVVSSNSREIQKKKFILPYNDMKVINSVIKEDFSYLLQLLKFNQFKHEFDALYIHSMKILNLLGEIPNNKINLYQNIQKLKFMELKFQS